MSAPPSNPAARSSVLLRALIALAAACAPSLRASPSPVAPPPAESADTAVRRWEYVVVVRTADPVADALPRVESAAFQAGGAVLAEVRTDWNGQTSDHRLLIRTRSPTAIGQVLREMRSQRGVVGATAIPLPETPTWPGSPDFFESYRGDAADFGPSNAGRVLMRHDLPPVQDKRELLEAADVLAGPDLQTPHDMLDAPGGFTLNVSQMLARLKQSAWQRREDRMRHGTLNILPPDGSTGSGGSGPSSSPDVTSGSDKGIRP